jgi:3-phosphoshikimate 1-carboxyvinyltransferase
MPETVMTVPAGPFDTKVTLPGDKSLGHRAAILAGMAAGVSEVRGLSPGADIGSTLAILRYLGVEITGEAITSPGVGRWTDPGHPLDCGNSGTTMRLMTGALAGSGISATLVGDASLMARPMRRLRSPLQGLGASVDISEAGTAPITIHGARLTGGVVTVPIPSAQVRTAVALAALQASGPVTIVSPGGFRDHTERWLTHLGHASRPDETTLIVRPGRVLPLRLTVPGDPSSAAYLWAAAAVRPGSRITTAGISLNPGRLGFLRILSAMGAGVEVVETGTVLGDPVGDVTVVAHPLGGVKVAGSQVAASIDELPLLAVVAASASGVTTVCDAGELRAKESDRLSASVRLARLAGAPARAIEDGFVVGDGDRADSVTIDSESDHRIAMAAAIAAVVRSTAIEIRRFDACAVSWPGFKDALEGLWS